jgi:hypothetical protein
MKLAYFEGKRWSIKSRLGNNAFVKELSKRSGVKEHAVRQVLKHFIPTVVDNVSHLRYVNTPLGIFYGVAKRSFREATNGGHYAKIIVKYYNHPWRYAKDSDFTKQGIMTTFSARSKKDHFVYEVKDDFMELHKQFLKSQVLPEPGLPRLQSLGLTGKVRGISKKAKDRINYVLRHKEEQYVPVLDSKGRPQMVKSSTITNVEDLPVVYDETKKVDREGTVDLVSRETEDTVYEEEIEVDLFDDTSFDWDDYSSSS